MKVERMPFSRRNVLFFLSVLILFQKVWSMETSYFNEELPQFNIPYKLSETGYVVAFYFQAGGNLNKTYKYTFSLDFQLNKAANESIQEARKLLGTTEIGDGATHKTKFSDFDWIRTGIRIPLELTISNGDVENSKILYRATFEKLWTVGYGDSIEKAIDAVKLEPGKYKIQLRVLSAVPELADIPVNFKISLPGKH